MKKIAIYTIQDANYGNRLQNLATKVLIERLNGKALVIRTTRTKLLLHSKYVTRIKNVIRRIVKQDRFNAFNSFNSKFEYARDYICADDYNICADKYYAIIAGSDQIWNMTFNTITQNAFLPFPHPRKIAFSASFGVDTIPYDQNIVDCLNDFKALSVREDSGAKIIKNLTGREATVLIDPTMLLTKEEWREVAKKPNGVKEGYILTYFLSPKCEAAKEKLEEIRESREVYELLNPNDKVAGTAGPAEFLWLFDHTDLVLTDSFHACVFSFLFNKPFLVYDRNWNEGNMNSRLDTLLKKFHLERKYTNSGFENDIWEHDYTEGYQQLELEREKALDFLKNALED